MQEMSKYTVFNIREYLNAQNDELGEDNLQQILSEFSCEKNQDVLHEDKEKFGFVVRGISVGRGLDEDVQTG